MAAKCTSTQICNLVSWRWHAILDGWRTKNNKLLWFERRQSWHPATGQHTKICAFWYQWRFLLLHCIGWSVSSVVLSFEDVLKTSWGINFLKLMNLYCFYIEKLKRRLYLMPARLLGWAIRRILENWILCKSMEENISLVGKLIIGYQVKLYKWNFSFYTITCSSKMCIEKGSICVSFFLVSEWCLFPCKWWLQHVLSTYR